MNRSLTGKPGGGAGANGWNQNSLAQRFQHGRNADGSQKSYSQALTEHTGKKDSKPPAGNAPAGSTP